MQDELARKKVLEAQLARLQALQAQNMERQRVRDEARRARAEAVANKAPVEALHTKGRVLEEKLAAISGGAGVVPVGLTPGSEGRMKSMVAKKQDELHMLLGLHVSGSRGWIGAVACAGQAASAFCIECVCYT